MNDTAITKATAQFSGKQAAAISLLELGLGSVLHSFRVPLTGHCLSLNQGYMLCRALQHEACPQPKPKIPVYISTTAALLKSLSPAGKRLTPMLAICVQGWLFAFGVFVGGSGVVGCTLGISLLGLWGFIQPLLLAYVFFGSALLEAGSSVIDSIGRILPLAPEYMLYGVVGVIVTKALIGVGLAVLACRGSGAFSTKYENFLLRHSPPRPVTKTVQRNSAVAAFLDLFNFPFIVCFVITAVFLLHAQSNLSTKIWLLLRPLAAGFAFYLVLRLVPVQRATQLLRTLRWTTLSAALETAWRSLENAKKK